MDIRKLLLKIKFINYHYKKISIPLFILSLKQKIITYVFNFKFYMGKNIALM